MGMSFDKPVRHLRDYLSILGPLSRQEPINYSGEMYSSMGAVTAKGATPFGIVVAALGPQMLKVAAELVRRHPHLVHGAEHAGRPHDPDHHAAADAAGRPAPRIIAALPVCVTTDTEAAAGRAAQVFEIYGTLPSYRAMLDREGAAGPADIAITGTEAEVVERISALADIGVTDFAAVEFPGNPDEAAATRAAVKLAMG